MPNSLMLAGRSDPRDLTLSRTILKINIKELLSVSCVCLGHIWGLFHEATSPIITGENTSQIDDYDWSLFHRRSDKLPVN
jgi:hypothetical protein